RERDDAPTVAWRSKECPAASRARRRSSESELDDGDQVGEPEERESSEVRGGLRFPAPALSAAIRDLADSDTGPDRAVEEVDAVLTVDVVGPERNVIENGPAGRYESRRIVPHSSPENGRGECVDDPARPYPETRCPRIFAARGIARAHDDVGVRQ